MFTAAKILAGMFVLLLAITLLIGSCTSHHSRRSGRPLAGAPVYRHGHHRPRRNRGSLTKIRYMMFRPIGLLTRGGHI